MRFLLDTNAYVALMRGNPEVAKEARRSEQIYISSIVVGELLYGFRYGTRYSENRIQLVFRLKSSVARIGNIKTNSTSCN